MIKLTAQLGSNPLRYHKPIRCILSDRLFSIGQNGEIIAWEEETLNPIYHIVPSVVGDAEKLIDMIITPLRHISD